MKKYSKKIALILVLSLTLAVAIPALATDTKITGRYKAPDIEVILPASTTAIVNPYGLPVEVKADDGETVVGKVNGSQVVAAKPLAGCNLGEVDLKIGATVVGDTKGDFRLASEKPDADSTMKTGLVYFEIKAGTDLSYTATPDTTANIGNFDGATIVSALNSWPKKAYSETNADQLLVSSRAVSKNGMATIKGTTAGAPVANSYFLARLAGDIVKAPRDEWVAADGVDVTISWILEPATT